MIIIDIAKSSCYNFAVMQTPTLTERTKYGSYLSGSYQGKPKAQIVSIPPRIQARLDVPQTALLLGFSERDIPILIAAKLLEPLGKPVPNATKYFAACDIKRLAANKKWLHDATQVLYDYWRGKNDRKAANAEIPLAA